jgi:arginase
VPNHFILTPFVLDQPSPDLEILAQSGWTINRPNLSDGNLQYRLSALHQPLADLVAQTVASGHRPVSIAGDCCTAIGVLAGLQRAGQDPTLIWLDAHGDFNTWETTSSGFLGGMPLAMVVGRGEQTRVNAVGLRPLPEAHCRPERWARS